MKRSFRLTILISVFLAVLVATLFGFTWLYPPLAPIKASDGPRPFHSLTEFHEWRDRYPANLGVKGKCDDLAVALSKLAADDGYLIGYTYVPYTGVIDGIRIFPENSWTAHVANLIMTDSSLYYYDDNSKQLVYIGSR